MIESKDKYKLLSWLGDAREEATRASVTADHLTKAPQERKRLVDAFEYIGAKLEDAYFLVEGMASEDEADRPTCTLDRGTAGLVHVTTGHCSLCGAENVKPAKYCTHCGAVVVAQ